MARSPLPLPLSSSLPLILPVLLLALCVPSALATPRAPSLDPPSASNTVPQKVPVLGHCECRCCRRSLHGQVQCDDTPHSVPLPFANSCDSRPTSSSDTSVCGTALCTQAFPNLCNDDSFVSHACVSDRGVLVDWAPLAFVSFALCALVYVAATHVSRRAYNPAEVPQGGYKRDPVPEPNLDVMQPLLSASRRSYGGSVGSLEVVDMSPRSFGRHSRRHSTPPPMHLLPGPAGVPGVSNTSPWGAALTERREALSTAQLEELRKLGNERQEELLQKGLS